MQKISYIATDDNLTLILGGRPKQVKLNSKHHRNDLVKVINAFNDSTRTEDEFKRLLNYLEPIKRIQLESDNRFEVEDSKLYLKGTDRPIESRLGDKILDFIENGLSINSLVKFWESCLRNPHYLAITELFDFIEGHNVPITDNGSFLLYKKLNFANSVKLPEQFEELVVNGDLVTTIDGKKVSPEIADEYLSFIKEANNPLMKDVWSGTISQKLGEEVKIPRVKFNEEEVREACGYGLHAGLFTYSFGGNVRVLVEIYPEDVIACNPSHEKLRTCKYKIVSFVDSQKEIKDLLVYLNSPVETPQIEDEWIEEITNPFSSGEVVRAIEDREALTDGDLYYIVETSDDDIKVIDDDGNEEWFDFSLFEYAK